MYLFIPTGLLVSLPDFLFVGLCCSRALSHGTLPRRPLKRPKSAILKSRSCYVPSLCWHALDCLQPAVLSLRHTPGCLKSPVKTRSCECGGSAPSHSVFLAGQPAADPNFNITFPASPSILIHELLIHPQLRVCTSAGH